MGLFERTRFVIAHNRRFGLETGVVEAANSKLAYLGKIVRGSAAAAAVAVAVAVPRDLAGIQGFAVVVVVAVAAAAAAAAAGEPAAGYNLGMPVIKTDCRNSKDTSAVLELPHIMPAVEEPALVHLVHQRDS